jgi:tRNA (cytidine32/uridine32-2'-O)-methyltransferase
VSRDPGQVLAEDLVIVLVQPLQPGNVGAVARAMANMGLLRLVLVDPPALDMERARWMASGGKPILDACRIVGTVEEAVADCTWAVGATARHRRWDWPAMEPAELAVQAFERRGPLAILFGREDHGLDNVSLSWCQSALRIPTSGEPSLNLAQAVLLTCGALFDQARSRGFRPVDEARRRSQPPRPKAKDRPGPLPMQRATVDQAVELLERTAFMNGRNPEQITVSLQALLSRADPSQRELEILLGMLAKTRYVMTGTTATGVGPTSPARAEPPEDLD